MPYYLENRERLLAYAKQYRNDYKELIKIKRQIKRRETNYVTYIIRSYKDGPIIKEYNGKVYANKEL